MNPHIFHITRIENLASIAALGLRSDSARIAGAFQATNIGNLRIKKRRLTRPVAVAAKGVLGDYVPFNFCPRSVMLYVVHCGHADYAGGQDDVVHLVTDVATVRALGRPWCFTDRHAELAHAAYFTDAAALASLPWADIRTNTWGGPTRQVTQEQKQAELLVHGVVSVDGNPGGRGDRRFRRCARPCDPRRRDAHAAGGRPARLVLLRGR